MSCQNQNTNHFSNMKSCCEMPGSKCCNANKSCCCEALSGISNVDQGFFQNISQKKIVDIPQLDLAYITNCDNNMDSDAMINLNPMYLTWNDFSILFFRNPGGAFYINPSNGYTSALAFSSQTYESTQNKKIAFSLYDQVTKAWSKKNNKSMMSLPIPCKIELERQTFLTKSISDVTCYQIGLSLDEALSTLLNKNEIQPGNSETFATVKFSISYRLYFCPLDTAITVMFTYITNVPCYKNVSDQSLCPYYSKETKPNRHVFDCDDTVMSSESSMMSMNLNTDKNENMSDNGLVTEYYLDEETTSGNTEEEIENIIRGGSISGSTANGWSKI